jgi:hypothetical protein
MSRTIHGSVSFPVRSEADQLWRSPSHLGRSATDGARTNDVTTALDAIGVVPRPEDALLAVLRQIAENAHRARNVIGDAPRAGPTRMPISILSSTTKHDNVHNISNPGKTTNHGNRHDRSRGSVVAMCDRLPHLMTG